jgi:hypothetical protein
VSCNWLPQQPTHCLEVPVAYTLPQFQGDLLHQPGPEANEFRAKLREYNSAFAFTSIKCKTTNRGVVGGGPMDFQIHGTLFHRTGPLENRTHAVPDGFAQFYLHDPAFGTDLRVAFFDGLHVSILTDLTEHLHEHNPFIPIYFAAREGFRHKGGPGRIISTKDFRDATIVPKDGYPLYRRRYTREIVAYKFGNREILPDNRFVVPHNPYLSKKYTFHINIEICATVKAVKYVHT